MVHNLLLSNMTIQSIPHYNFILALPPGKSFAAVAHTCEKKITVLNLEGIEQQLSINTGIRVLCLGVTGRTVVAVGERKVSTWNVPAGGCGPNAGENIDEDVQTTTVDYPTPPTQFFPLPRVSIFPNCNYIACIVDESGFRALNIYDVSTGRHLTGTTPDGTVEFSPMWFAQDNLEAWCSGRRGWCGWTIIGGDKPSVRATLLFGSQCAMSVCLRYPIPVGHCQ